MVVRLPREVRLTGAKLRLTLCGLTAESFHRIERAMDDDENWESILPQFDYERSLSDFIVSSPHRLEDGLVPYPSAKAREMVFQDQSRLDVLLLDHDQHPVVVECKQGTPRIEDIKQLRGYMRNAQKLRNLGTGQVRGILVHGGARKLPVAVRRESMRKPQVELVQHSVNVSFARSS
jgi:RecB family endonuclease NucS